MRRLDFKMNLIGIQPSSRYSSSIGVAFRGWEQRSEKTFLRRDSSTDSKSSIFFLVKLIQDSELLTNDDNKREDLSTTKHSNSHGPRHRS